MASWCSFVVHLGRQIDKEENCKVGSFNWVHKNEIQI